MSVRWDMDASSYSKLFQKKPCMEGQRLYSVFGGFLTGQCIIFCFFCWMYYSVILKLDKGEAGTLRRAGDFPVRQSWRKIDSREFVTVTSE